MYNKKSVGANGCWPVNNNIKIKLNVFGLIVDEELKNTENIRNEIKLDQYFKSVVTKRINVLRNTPRKPVWQRAYYDHVIRDGKTLNNIRDYIVNNPITWETDKNNCYISR